MTLVALDFDQGELRLLAHYCQSETMLDAFLTGKDLHAITADGIFGDHENEHRQWGKTINFACGMLIGVMGLYDVLWEMGRETTVEEAKGFLNRWHELYPQARALAAAAEKVARKKGYIELWTGRRCHLEPQDARKGHSRLVQGGLAELIKEGFLRSISGFNKFGAEPILIVHDEILALVNTPMVEEFIPRLIEAFSFETVLGPGQAARFGEPIFRVPMTVSVKTSTKSWGEMEEWKDPLESSSSV
jgi:DNA polymerase-1